jgi:hypothetical protein
MLLFTVVSLLSASLVAAQTCQKEGTPCSVPSSSPNIATRIGVCRGSASAGSLFSCIDPCTSLTATSPSVLCFKSLMSTAFDASCTPNGCTGALPGTTGCAVDTVCTVQAATGTTTGRFQLIDNVCKCVLPNPPMCSVNSPCQSSGGVGTFQLVDGGCKCVVPNPLTCTKGASCMLSGTTAGVFDEACKCVARQVTSCAVDTACTVQTATGVTSGRFQLIDNVCKCVLPNAPTCSVNSQCQINGGVGTFQLIDAVCKCVALQTNTCTGECRTETGAVGIKKLGDNNACLCVATTTSMCQVGAQCSVSGGVAGGKLQLIGTECKCVAPDAMCFGECKTETGAAGDNKFVDNRCVCVARPINTCSGECKTEAGAVGIKKLDNNMACVCVATTPNTCFGECKNADGTVGDNKVVDNVCKCVPRQSGTCSGECKTENGAVGIKKVGENNACVCVATTTNTCFGECKNADGTVGENKLISGKCTCVPRQSGTCSGECKTENGAVGIKKLGENNACLCVATSLPSRCPEGSKCQLAMATSTTAITGVCRKGECAKFECQADSDCQTAGASATAARVCQNFQCVAAPVNMADPCTTARRCENGGKCVVIDAQKAGLTGMQVKETADAALAAGTTAAVCACATGFTGPLCEFKVETETMTCKCAADQKQRDNRCVAASGKTCDCLDATKCVEPPTKEVPQGEQKLVSIVFNDKSSLLQALGLVQSLLGDSTISGVIITADRLPATADGKESFRVTVATKSAISDELRTKIAAVAAELLKREDVLAVVDQIMSVDVVDPMKPGSAAASVSIAVASVVAALAVRL